MQAWGWLALCMRLQEQGCRRMRRLLLVFLSGQCCHGTHRGRLPTCPPAVLSLSHPQVRAVPLDRLLLESDSPDGELDLSPAWLEALPSLAALPQQLQAAGLHQLNRPAALRFTLQIIAAALGRSEAEVAAATRDNARRIFCSIGGSSSAAAEAAG